MKMVYKRKDADFEDRFPHIRMYNCTGENKKLPSSVTVDFDLVEGQNTLDLLLYNFFLEYSGYEPFSDVAQFIRIEKADLMSLLRCGRCAFDASLKRLIANESLFVLKEVGKVNAYCVRT